MSGFEFFQHGDGLRIEAGTQMVEFGLTWDGDERMTFRMDAEQLREIAQEALDRKPPAPPCPYPHHPTMERPWTVEDVYDDISGTGRP